MNPTRHIFQTSSIIAADSYAVHIFSDFAFDEDTVTKYKNDYRQINMPQALTKAEMDNIWGYIKKARSKISG